MAYFREGFLIFINDIIKKSKNINDVSENKRVFVNFSVGHKTCVEDYNMKNNIEAVSQILNAKVVLTALVSCFYSFGFKKS